MLVQPQQHGIVRGKAEASGDATAGARKAWVAREPADWKDQGRDDDKHGTFRPGGKAACGRVFPLGPGLWPNGIMQHTR